ncbi:InlB B-repeat-containing protein [Bacteroides ovatus]|jgi:uncharacterized repeat protein (TIGR02543 family)|uniref:InlB B-repeat-containing protein n=1 Tax=Bacteroides ovatus TaxID=28116 RepID=UPI001896D560|nr:InlB B-repeat-containing protein [Bacteroides ovatus]MDC2733972.1 InlB B-repeat-containing protein [Bacteroides ovatus]
MKTLKKLLWLAAVLLCIVSCSKEEVTEKVIEVPEGKVLVETEIVVDGVIQSKTRASSNAGYTTGDGLYDSGDKVIVAAVANEGYELAAFYDKKYPSTNLGTSYEFPAAEPRTFKAEFARKYTITVSASPTAGGTVSGGGTYRSGKPCTLTATPNAGYTFDGWYEGSTKLSSNTSYSFTVSSNRTITGKFNGNIQIDALVDVVRMSPYVTKIFYLKSSVPVTTPITSICQIIHEEYREDYEGTEELIFSEVITAKFTIPIGKTESNKEGYTSGGSGNQALYYLKSKDHSLWNIKTFNGFTYKLGSNNW